ncbi:MAG TPA: ABC transporter ATP-binding protein [Clostridia bacterium]|nr:ABC transporter ATP-binding protein [Clostridia bacterium]HRX41751.1 ABC transporter ATP-binding protein [Clostridia bacterium]
MEYIVEMLGIRKEFPGVLANDNVTVQLKKGEILALLGENGAGKSTLMSILFGLFHMDKGKIKIRGKEVRINNPNDANALGIGMVHQHFQLVETFTVTENIIMGVEDGFVLDRKKAGKRIKELSEQYGLNINPDEIIEDISVGMQQRVEILKMLYRNAEVLIFDEPTAVLTPQEIHELMEIMRNLIKEGKSIILITHKLKEIKEIADRCTVIRRGKVIGTVEVNSTSTQQMADMMVGREVSFTVDKKAKEAGEVVLEIDGLNVLNNRKTLGLKDFTLQVRRGEIVGVAGVEGNGQTELVEAVTGLRKIESGSVSILGQDTARYSVRKKNEAGIAHIPEDRQKFGLVMEYTLAENFVLKSYYHPPYSNFKLLNKDIMNEHAEKLIKDFDVRAGQGSKSPAKALSGGNQQKAILGREIDLDTDLLIAVQPTRGLDVGAIEYIHKRLVEQRDSGKAVLLVSLELDEIMDLSDRIAVINSGELIDLVINDDSVNEYDIGLMMAGVKRGDEQ